MQRQKCENCAFWRMTSANVNQGECTVKAPSVFPMPSARGLATFTAFPITTREQGCAEFIADPGPLNGVPELDRDKVV